MLCSKGRRNGVVVAFVVTFVSSSAKGFSSLRRISPLCRLQGSQQGGRQRRQRQQRTQLWMPTILVRRTIPCHSLTSVNTATRRLSLSLFSSSSSSLFESSDAEDFDVSDFLFPSADKEEVALELKPELWLDLRQTALSPRIATESLLEATTNDVCLIDRILVSDEKARMAMEGGMDGPAVVWVEHEDEDYMDSSPTATSTLRRLPFLERDWNADFGGLPGVPEGRIVPISDDGRQLPDPIPYVETVDRGGWVLVDSSERRDQSSENQLENLLKKKGKIDMDDDGKGRYDAVTGFVDFLLQAAGGSMLKSPVLLGNTNEEEDDDDVCLTSGGCGTGGVAIRCTHKQDVLRFASYFQSSLLADTLKRGGFLGGGGVLSETKSGIVFQSAEDDELLQTRRKNETSPIELPPQLRCALVLPFDAVMWKAASLLAA